MPSPRHRSTFYRGTDIPPGPDIMYAINRTATIALPMSSIVCLSTATPSTQTEMSFEQWYETATLSQKFATSSSLKCSHAARADAALFLPKGNESDGSDARIRRIRGLEAGEGVTFKCVQLLALPAYHQMSIKIAADLGAKVAIGMHWGTFPLSEVPLYESAQRFMRAGRHTEVRPLALRIGECLVLDGNPCRAQKLDWSIMRPAHKHDGDLRARVLRRSFQLGRVDAAQMAPARRAHVVQSNGVGASG
jgi:hypothetical protein